MARLTLFTMANGYASDIFDAEYQKVLENISNPETEAKKVRKITITFEFRPDDKRSFREVSIYGKSSLAVEKITDEVNFDEQQLLIEDVVKIVKPS